MLTVTALAVLVVFLGMLTLADLAPALAGRDAAGVVAPLR
jgi:hypothetical protein